MSIYGKHETREAWLEALGKAIRKKRVDMDLTIRGTAEVLHMGRDTIHAIELGYDTMKLDLVLKLANYVGLELCDNMCEIGRRIAAARVYRGKTQRDLASASFISRNPVDKIESQGRSPYMSTFLCICESLEINPMKILRKNW